MVENHDCDNPSKEGHQNHPIVHQINGSTLYRFSLVGKWHYNPFCTGQKTIQTKEFNFKDIVIMEDKGQICKKCKPGWNH